MRPFRGFQETEITTPIPDAFFQELLAQVNDVSEMKVILHALWNAEHAQGGPRGLAEPDFEAAALGLSAGRLRAGLEKAVRDAILVRTGTGRHKRYFLNSPAGRAAAKAVAADGSSTRTQPSLDALERTNVFKVFEENIGPLTPLIADALRDAEESYPQDWILEAIELSARNNKRSWSYCEAILRRWKEEGRGKKQNRRDDQAARQRDVEEKIRKFIRG